MKQALSIALLLVVAFAVGRYTAPAKVVESVKTEIQVKRDTVVVEKVRKDGTKVTVTKIKDRSEEATKKEKIIDFRRPEWLLGGGIDTKGGYVLSVDRRILGPIFIGAFGSTSGIFGAKIGIEL